MGFEKSPLFSVVIPPIHPQDTYAAPSRSLRKGKPITPMTPSIFAPFLLKDGSCGFQSASCCHKIINQHTCVSATTSTSWTQTTSQPLLEFKALLYTFPGSLPILRTSTRGTPSRSARGAAKMNPRASIPAMQSIFLPLQSASSLSMQYVNAVGTAKIRCVV